MSKVVFLDRDGTINYEGSTEGGYVTAWKDFRFIDGVFDALKRLKDCKLFVFSNQKCVAKELLSYSGLVAINNNMVSAFKERGIVISGVYFCPHNDEDGCSCRKPKPGMLLNAAKEHAIDLRTAFVIGDSERDILAGKAVGCKTVLVLSGKLKNVDNVKVDPDFVCKNLGEAVSWINKIS